MKKLFGLILVVVLLSSMASAQEILKMSSLAPGTSAYLVNSTFVNIVNEALDDVEIQLNATGAGTMHTLQTATGEIDFSMGSAIVFGLLSNGQAMYAEVPNAPELSKNLRGMFAYPIGTYHIVVNADSDITEWEDFAGKRVFFGPPGGAATRTILGMVENITGLTNEDFDLVNLGWGAAQQAMQDGQLDVYVVPTLPPSPGISQIALTKEIRLIGITDEQKLASGQQPTVDRGVRRWGTIPAGTYGDNQANDSDVQMLEPLVGVETNVQLDQETVYNITKAWWAGAEAQRENAPWLSEITLENAFIGMAAPLHAGAIQFYQEQGMEIPDRLVPEECLRGDDGMLTCLAE